MNKRPTLIRRAGLAGLVLTASVSVTALGAGPSSAAETYSSYRTGYTLDYQPTFDAQDLFAARIARYGITPIPIP
jgi:hypothetical protein